ncbi:MAG: U32 family peptidase [Ignavibacteria bacterium]|nr:U32 family peptidase [Ignavibacteria bacterium]
MPKKNIELLAPARDCASGIAAIEYGADAVYIGAPRFGARVAAGNSLDDISRLIEYAHLFHAKVYITLNTVLYDNELDEVQSVIMELDQAGIDALIIQDMGILQMQLPPVPLYASTQAHNHTAERVLFLQHAGFQRAILARELSLEQIRHISSSTSLELEAFIHGALCVSYSGQCYFSHATTGRSANRGTCSQSCRLPYTLSDASGKIIAKDKHLLSLKDLNLSEYLNDLLGAGISSFKIEGRLKDINYVKNITAFYRQKLDTLIAGSEQYQKSSSGNSHFTFTPDPEKTFNRGYSTYFISGSSGSIASHDTPKSLGKPLGRVTNILADCFTIDTIEDIVPGDGICFLDEHDELKGMFVNRAVANTIYTANLSGLITGTMVYRNNDHTFEALLANDKTKRKIRCSIDVCFADDNIKLTVADEDGITAAITCSLTGDEVKNPSRLAEQIRIQLGKSGDTIFTINSVNMQAEPVLFMTISSMNEVRRELLTRLRDNRLNNYTPVRKARESSTFSSPLKALDYRANITNSLAEQFYTEHGVTEMEPGFELQNNFAGKVIMTTRYCIKKELKMCPFDYPEMTERYLEPLYIDDGKHKFKLTFNCSECIMQIMY